MMKISATIITLNEESNIGDCLKSLDFVDEIIVVDSGSTDRTEEICRADRRVRFHSMEWLGFGKQKNRAAELAQNEWVFNIDADERVSHELRGSIVAADGDSFSGFQVARENYFGKQWIRHCGWYPDYNLRLYNRSDSRFSEREVHESVICGGRVGRLSGNLIHYSYRNISDYLQRMNRYSSLAAEQMVADGKRSHPLLLPVRPVFTFFKMYVLRGGVLDGYHGFLLSLLYAFYTLCKYAKFKEFVRSGQISSRPARPLSP